MLLENKEFTDKLKEMIIKPFPPFKQFEPDDHEYKVNTREYTYFDGEESIVIEVTQNTGMVYTRYFDIYSKPDTDEYKSVLITETMHTTKASAISYICNFNRKTDGKYDAECRKVIEVIEKM